MGRGRGEGHAGCRPARVRGEAAEFKAAFAKYDWNTIDPKAEMDSSARPRC
jgi:hypothetical protein